MGYRHRMSCLNWGEQLDHSITVMIAMRNDPRSFSLKHSVCFSQVQFGASVIRMLEGLEGEEYCVDVIKRVAVIEVALKKSVRPSYKTTWILAYLWLLTKRVPRFGAGL